MYSQKTKRLIIGDGESFGHKHVLTAPQPIHFDVRGDSFNIMISETALLTHDDHDRMVFQRGKFRSYHQVEFNPMDGSVGNVFD